jgi:folate-binding protein YgfZ
MTAASSTPATLASSSGSPEAAGRASRENVLVVPAADRAAILITGKDRTSWLNGLVTCELAKRERGQGAYGLLVEKKGRIQTDLFLVPSADEAEATLALAVPASLRESLLSTLDHYLIMEDAELSASDLVFFVAHGPRAAELRSLAPYAGTVDLLGTGGLVLGVPADGAAALETRLRETVATLGGVFADDATWDAVRIEAGLPRFGAEVDATLYPQEAALEKLAVSFSKGCYLGQEVVYMLQERGHVKRKLVPLDLDLDQGDALPAVGTAVTTPAGEAVGEIKSAAIGPSSGKHVAIAMVKWAHAKQDTELRVGDRTARVR